VYYVFVSATLWQHADWQQLPAIGDGTFGPAKLHNIISGLLSQ
jgi:hypothetical protein